MPRPPLGFLGALVLIAGVESILEANGDFLASYSGLGARFAARATSSPRLDGSILALGDSVMKFGFDPQAVEDSTGVKAFNLAVPGTPPPLALALLRRTLKTGAEPKAIVIGTMTLAGDPNVHVSDFAEAFSPLDAYELARDAERPALFLEILSARLLPSVRYRLSLRGTILGAFDGSTTSVQSSALSKLAIWSEHAGHEPREVGVAPPGRMDPELERRLYSNPWKVESSFEKALRRLVALADDRGIPVFWVVPPIRPDAQSRRDALGLDEPHTRNLLATLKRIPNATLLDARRCGYPESAFFDSCHLNAGGAAQLSDQIAKAILDRNQGFRPENRLIQLPAYRNEFERSNGLAARNRKPGR